jgi:RHS repeat-associated protein
VTYTLDVTGKITQVDTTLNSQTKTLASSITYLPFGGITGLTYGNSLSLSHGYDNQYRSSSIEVDPVLDRAYEYDANGNVTLLEDDEAAGNEALESPGIYTYDQYTNLLADITWGQNTIVYDYDDNANTVSTDNRTYVYDSSNQLIQVLDNSNQIAGYTYNGAGQRIKKVTQSGTKIFHYDLKGHLIAETDEDGEMIAEYIYLGEKLLAMITKPSETEIVSYFHNDHLGTPLILTNDNETIVWKAAYTPFGGADISVQTVGNPFRLPGQYYDPETGLHYNYFRYYNPATGRYITPDPIGLEGEINLWPYVRNNPINWIDPLGLWRKKGQHVSPNEDMDKRLQCLDKCTSKEVNVTYAEGGHADLGRISNPCLTRDTMKTCFDECFTKDNPKSYGQEEYNGPGYPNDSTHFHLTTYPSGYGTSGFQPGILPYGKSR